MADKTLSFLSEIKPFDMLPENELKKMIDLSLEKHFREKTVLFNQGKSTIDGVYVIQDGTLEMFFEKEGEKIVSRRLEKGDSFGGISILINGGISIRTVEVVENTRFRHIPKKVFLDYCSRFPSFQEYFMETYNEQMMDETFAGVIAKNQAASFLHSVVPFSFLPEFEIEKVARKLEPIHYPKETVIIEQDKSRVEYLYILQKGAAERYFVDNSEKILRGFISEGEVFGGISLLINDGIALRSMKTLEDSHFFLLPKNEFFDICNRNEAFSDYFTDTFGKRMLDRSYAAIVSKRQCEPEEQRMPFFNQRVDDFFTKDPISCQNTSTIRETAKIMNEKNCSSVLIKDANGDYQGLVTDQDMRKKVVASGMDVEEPVETIVSLPLIKIPASSLIFEALMEMMNKQVKHLAVTDTFNKVTGIITNRDLLSAQGNSPYFLLREIQSASLPEDLFDKHEQLAPIIENLIHNGAKAKNITSLITTISDAILNKLIEFALADLGAPPVPFVFMIMGSEGRKEQTLKTDQDNAIVYEDVDKNSEEKVREYFLAFGDKVCTWLDKAGYDFCEGGIMAKNPKWCQSISTWKEYFKKWIFTAEAEDLFHSTIFFDFRGAYGEMKLIEDLRKFLFGSLEGWAGFFRHLTENALHFRPPLGFFRNFVVESRGERRNVLDIKHAMVPIVDYARIHALKKGIDRTNTQERLEQLHIKKAISEQDYNDLNQAYSFLMQLRFFRQVTAVIEENSKPDNYLNPKILSRIEQTTMKEIFKRIEKYQSKLSFEFTGIS